MTLEQPRPLHERLTISQLTLLYLQSGGRAVDVSPHLIAIIHRYDELVVKYVDISTEDQLSPAERFAQRQLLAEREKTIIDRTRPLDSESLSNAAGHIRHLLELALQDITHQHNSDKIHIYESDPDFLDLLYVFGVNFGLLPQELRNLLINEAWQRCCDQHQGHLLQQEESE